MTRYSTLLKLPTLPERPLERSQEHPTKLSCPRCRFSCSVAWGELGPDERHCPKCTIKDMERGGRYRLPNSFIALHFQYEAAALYTQQVYFDKYIGKADALLERATILGNAVLHSSIDRARPDYE